MQFLIICIKFYYFLFIIILLFILLSFLVCLFLKQVFSANIVAFLSQSTVNLCYRENSVIVLVLKLEFAIDHEILVNLVFSIQDFQFNNFFLQILLFFVYTCLLLYRVVLHNLYNYLVYETKQRRMTMSLFMDRHMKEAE